MKSKKEFIESVSSMIARQDFEVLPEAVILGLEGRVYSIYKGGGAELDNNGNIIRRLSRKEIKSIAKKFFGVEV